MGVIRGGLPGRSTALVTPPGVKDRFGDAITPGRSWSVKGCWLSPLEGTEDQFRATTGVSQWKLYAPVGSSFPLGATVVIDGVTARVSAPVEPWTTCGLAVSLERVTG